MARKSIPLIIGGYVIDIHDAIRKFNDNSHKCPYKKNCECVHPDVVVPPNLGRAVGCIWQVCPAGKKEDD
jgi:hypothetical protein